MGKRSSGEYVCVISFLITSLICLRYGAKYLKKVAEKSHIMKRHYIDLE